MEMLVSVPLMGDWTERSIPIENFMRGWIVKAPLLKGLGPECTEIIDDALALLPHDQFGNGLGASELVAVIEVVVKALVGARHFDISLVPFIDHGAKICLNGLLFAHGGSTANGGFVAQGVQGFLTVGSQQPVSILGRLA